MRGCSQLLLPMHASPIFWSISVLGCMPRMRATSPCLWWSQLLMQQSMCMTQVCQQHEDMASSPRLTYMCKPSMLRHHHKARCSSLSQTS